MLCLYDHNGKTQLKWNDDGDSGLASLIKWTAPKSGTYYFKVTGFDNKLTGSYKVSLAAGAAGTLSAKSVDDQPAAALTGEDSPVAPISPAKSGAAFLMNAAFLNRITAGWMNSGGPVPNLNGASLGSEAFNAVADHSLITPLAQTSLISRYDTSVLTAENRTSVASLSLLDRHPALRSMLGSMLLDGESPADLVHSMHLNLDALDALFARADEVE